MVEGGLGWFGVVSRRLDLQQLLEDVLDALHALDFPDNQLNEFPDGIPELTNRATRICIVNYNGKRNKN